MIKNSSTKFSKWKLLFYIFRLFSKISKVFRKFYVFLYLIFSKKLLQASCKKLDAQRGTSPFFVILFFTYSTYFRSKQIVLRFFYYFVNACESIIKDSLIFKYPVLIDILTSNDSLSRVKYFQSCPIVNLSLANLTAVSRQLIIVSSD